MIIAANQTVYKPIKGIGNRVDHPHMNAHLQEADKTASPQYSPLET